MRRKIFVGVFTIVIMVALMAPALAQEKVIKWKVQGFVPAGMLYHETLQRTAEEVKTLTGGRLVWEVFPAGALVPPLKDSRP